ncbi:MAG TPA: NAD-dependent epimerase/dehydratase family protein, partial [Micromonosporaceae bacterium]
ALTARGDDVMVVHRGITEPADLPPCRHVHVDRRNYGNVAATVRDFRPEAVLDCTASSAADVGAVLPYLPDVPIVLLSSMDVYRVYELLLGGDDTPSPVPCDEEAPLRVGRYPYRGRGIGEDDYDKLDVEPAYLARGASVLRLGMIYGPRDPQTREEFVLRRVRAGRDRIPIGPAATVFTRLHIDDAAAAIVAALDRPDVVTGQVLNIGESGSYSMLAWIRLILEAAGHRAELVHVPDGVLPSDLRLTRAVPQHFLFTSAKAMSLLDWRPAESAAAVASSVRWHLAHPPADGDVTDFAADDAALAAVI